MRIKDLPVSFEVDDFPVNCADLSACMKLPLLKMITSAPECSMKLSEILSSAPSFLNHESQLGYYVMRDKLVLCELQSLLDETQPSKK